MKITNLRNYREDYDMTQSQIGEYLHVSQRAYSHYESGSRDVPIEILIKLANLYCISLDELVGREFPKK